MHVCKPANVGKSRRPARWNQMWTHILFQHILPFRFRLMSWWFVSNSQNHINKSQTKTFCEIMSNTPELEVPVRACWGFDNKHLQISEMCSCFSKGGFIGVCLYLFQAKISLLKHETNFITTSALVSPHSVRLYIRVFKGRFYRFKIWYVYSKVIIFTYMV